DFNNDGKPDILWHNAGTGQISVWLMNGTQFRSAASFGGKSAASLPWHPVATGDFNGDGKPDILWHNAGTGQISVWLMNGTQFISATNFGGKSAASLPWHPVATGDFNGDGKPDILWHNAGTGQISVWLMNGTQF